MAMKVIDAKYFESLSPFFRGERGNRRAELAIRLLSIDKVNYVYDHSYAYTGAEFTERLLDDIGINYIVGNAERLNVLPAGPFITISNHPYGGLDGIMLIDLIARIRSDYRLMVNKLLSLIKTMEENFISVTPTGNKIKSITSASIDGIRKTLAHLHAGHPAGFFPSGAVSDFSLRDMRIRDRKWQTSILHLIKSVKVPVVPIRFFDKNSPFFYFLGVINWRIRAIRLPSEVFNKKGQQPRIGVGNTISVEEQEHFKDIGTFGNFLRKTVYEMPLPEKFIPRKKTNN
jgi:putative hemolysin